MDCIIFMQRVRLLGGTMNLRTTSGRFARHGPFELDRIELEDLEFGPSPGRLRAALLLVYAGLLLTLASLL